MSEAPKCHWSHFSLRTLFVLFTLLAVVLGWIAYHIHWIRQRQALLNSPYVLWSGDDWQKSVRPPGMLELFGEHGRRSVRFYMDEHGRPCDLNAETRQADLDQEMKRAKQLFPEASVDTFVTTRTASNDPAHAGLTGALQQLGYKNTLRISISAQGEVEVTTGDPLDPESNRGEKVSLRKINGAWVVTNVKIATNN